MCISMTKEVFLQLEAAIKCSGKTIKAYCSEQSIPYSTYNYWRKKYLSSSDAGLLAPVSFASQCLSPSSTKPSGVVIQLPTGVQIEFAQSNDAVALQVLNGMCSNYVFPK